MANRKEVIDLTGDDDDDDNGEIRLERRKKRARRGVSFVLAPGSGNGTGGLEEVLSTFGTVVAVDRWAGTRPSDTEANVVLLRSLLTKDAVLVGYSYGCCVVALLLTHEPALARRVSIFCAYPLYEPRPPRDWGGPASVLRKLPAHARLLFLSGDGDEWLARRWQPRPHGPDALRAVLPRATVVPVHGAGHLLRRQHHNLLKRAVADALAATSSHDVD
mmetsp:Transcript_8179/g.25247  ORF Transcript_8179/g.25247 Transcript_8179/m.25247 type:complete len:218 (-) Transcript_8179:1250-1903(-)